MIILNFVSKPLKKLTSEIYIAIPAIASNSISITRDRYNFAKSRIQS
ncbi:MAG: hypothetical protein ACOYN8_00695 [Pseudanabaena sp.]